MKILQTYRADFPSQGPKSALRGRWQRVGLTVFACTLVIGAAGSAKGFGSELQQAVNVATQAVPPISGVIGKVQSFSGSALEVQTPSGAVHIEVSQPLTCWPRT